MTIIYKDGCLLDAFDAGEVATIAHCVNTRGVMGAGIAKQIKERYPENYLGYLGFVDFVKEDRDELLGLVYGGHKSYEYCQGKIFNIFGQKSVGTKNRQLNYAALTKCLLDISFSFRYSNHYYGKNLGIPYKMGCGLAGGDWEIVLEIIEFVFKDSKTQVVIYKPNKGMV